MRTLFAKLILPIHRAFGLLLIATLLTLALSVTSSCSSEMVDNSSNGNDTSGEETDKEEDDDKFETAEGSVPVSGINLLTYDNADVSCTVTYVDQLSTSVCIAMAADQPAEGISDDVQLTWQEPTYSDNSSSLLLITGSSAPNKLSCAYTSSNLKQTCTFNTSLQEVNLKGAFVLNQLQGSVVVNTKTITKEAAVSEAQFNVLALGFEHSCALLDTGAVRCWGKGIYGQLGYANTNHIGDDETPASAGDVNVGGSVLQLVAGEYHTCVLVDTGAVRCWGRGTSGELGYANTNNIGDDETPASAGDVDVGGTVIQIAGGYAHTCALLNTGAVRCWGNGILGGLGYGNTTSIGDDETPASVGLVDVGGIVTQIVAGKYYTCALLDTGAVRCWGDSTFGRLGYGNTNDIGDNETPASAGDVDVGGTVTQLAAGWDHTCALLDTGAVRCWGRGLSGRLGYSNTIDIGDNETPASAGDVTVGGTVIQITAGDHHTCALLNTGAVRCWGRGGWGRLGYGNVEDIGDFETPDTAGDVDIGGTVIQVISGGDHTCALLDTLAIRCWGDGRFGELGYVSTIDIGDDEVPSTAGDVNIGGLVGW